MAMSNHQRKVELLAPAGNLEKLEIALHYGADAVYLAGKAFSLRNFSGNFAPADMRPAVEMAHRAGVKVYVACNTYPRNRESDGIADFLSHLGGMDIDAIIIADPGVLRMARRIVPHKPIHLSTQANTTNTESVMFWQDLGIKRINIARELSLAEIRQVTEAADIQIEAFVHGSMCIAYSGRCLLSSFLTDRDANRGSCSHPCRWKYSMVEEKRPGQPLPVEEDDRGSYILNSRDLCMIEHLPDLIQTGVASLKIEGRMKGINYLATTVKTYRDAIDAYYAGPQTYQVRPEWIEALQHVSNRGYCTGFYFGHPDQIQPDTTKHASSPGYSFVARVLAGGRRPVTRILVRNKIEPGDRVEIFSASEPAWEDQIISILDNEGSTRPVAQAGEVVDIHLRRTCQVNDLIRKPIAY
jgi:putative protease